MPGTSPGHDVLETPDFISCISSRALRMRGGYVAGPGRWTGRDLRRVLSPRQLQDTLMTARLMVPNRPNLMICGMGPCGDGAAMLAAVQQPRRLPGGLPPSLNN